MTLEELIDQLSKHNIKVVDWDDENSVKAKIFEKIRGEKLRGHIAPSSFLDPSGELTIYVPRSKDTPEKLKRFLIEEIKHIDQLRDTPIKTAILGLYEGTKEIASTFPSKLLNKLPDFVSEEESEEHFQKLIDAGRSGKDLDEIESPSWKDRSGIGQLFRDFHYDQYEDPESVEGIHINEERYGPVLEKYGVGKQAGGYVMNYGDYGRSYT